MRWISLAALGVLFGCGPASSPSPFQDTAPAFNPVRFFTGHVRSWGVLENRSGAPTDIVTTDCVGEADGADGVHMIQTLKIGAAAPQVRQWKMRRTAPGRFEATANDMVGTAAGEAVGRAFHWRWTLALQPGNSIKDVTMEQWWYLLDDGSMMNRTTVSKLGYIAAEVTEHFAPVRQP